MTKVLYTARQVYVAACFQVCYSGYYHLPHTEAIFFKLYVRFVQKSSLQSEPYGESFGQSTTYCATVLYCGLFCDSGSDFLSYIELIFFKLYVLDLYESLIFNKSISYQFEPCGESYGQKTAYCPKVSVCGILSIKLQLLKFIL